MKKYILFIVLTTISNSIIFTSTKPFKKMKCLDNLSDLNQPKHTDPYAQTNIQANLPKDEVARTPTQNTTESQLTKK